MRRPWLALFFPLVRAQELAVVRSFVAAEDVDESLRSWSVYPPCRWSPATPVDLILVSGQQVQSEWRPSEPTHVINDTSWRHCFREILVMPVEAAAQRYEGAHDAESAASLRRNMVFLHVLSRLYEGFAADYDSFFFMEADATVVRTGWLERFISEAVHPKNSAIRGSSYRGDGWDNVATDLLHHINGNAIYNLRHPWLRSLHDQLAREAFTAELAQIPFDLRMANLTLEAQRGSQELLEEVYQDDSKLIGSFGSTLLNHSFEPGVFIRQGSSRNIFFNLEAELSLGVAAFEADVYQKFNETLTSRHPFRKVLVLSYGPRAIQPFSESMGTPRGPTEVLFKHAKTSRHLALCEIASQVTTKFFIFSDIYHLISGPASVLVDGEGRPVLPYLDAKSPDCASTFGCGPSLQQARQLFGIQLQRHFDTFDVVFRTAQIQRFCEDWQLAVPQGSFETCAVEFGPTADDFFAWAISRGQSPFESYVPKDKAQVRWIPVLRRHAPPPMDLARPCSAYQQFDYDRMKANISICSTIIENAARCEETVTSHGPCVFNVFGHCTENKKMLHWPHLVSEESDNYQSRRLVMEQLIFSNLTTTEHTETTVITTTTYHVNRSNASTTTETSQMTMITTTDAYKTSTNESDDSDESTTSHTTAMTVTTKMFKSITNSSNGSTTTETSHMTMMTTTDKYMPGMNGSNGSTTTATSHMTMMTTTDMYVPGMNGSNGSTTTETSHMTMMTTTDKYMPGMNGSNGTTSTETTTTTMLVVPVARLEGCVGLSVSDPELFSESADAVSVMKRVLARAAGGVKVDYVHVSITAGSSCESGRRLFWGYRRLQESVRVDYVIIFPASMGEGEALTQAEDGKAALEQISLSEINALMSEEIGMMPSLSGLSVLITTSPTVMMTVFVSTSNNLNGSNGSTTTETSHMTMMTTTDKYMPGMNLSNDSTITETTTATMTSTMFVVPVARLEGCMGLSVSDAAVFSTSADAITVMKRVLAEAAGVAVDYVEVSMVVGSSCAGRRLVLSGLSERRLQETVRVDYVIIFPASMGEEEALEAAQNSTASLSQITLSEISALMTHEMSLMPSLSGMTVVVTSTPTVVMIVLVGATNTTTSTTETTTTSMTTTSTNTTSTSRTWTSATNTTTITSVTGTTSMTTTATNTSMTNTQTSTVSLTTATNTTTTTSITGTTSMTTTSKTTSTTASDTATSTSISMTNTTTMTSVTGTTSFTTTVSSTTTFTGSSTSITNTTTQTSVTSTTSMTTTSTATSVTSSTSRTMSSTLTSTSATSSTSVTGTSTSKTNTTTFTVTTTTSFTTSVSTSTTLTSTSTVTNTSTATITTSTSLTMSTSLTSSTTYTMSTTSSLTSFTITSTSLTNTSTSTSLTRTTSYTDTSTSETSTSTSASTSITSVTTTSTSSITGTSTSVSTSITSTTSQTTTHTTTNTTTTSSTSFTTSVTSTSSSSGTMTSTTSLTSTTESSTTQSTTSVTTITQTTTSVSSTLTHTSTTTITFTTTSKTITTTISSTTSGTLTSTTSGTATSTSTQTESTTSQTTSSTSKTSTTTSLTMTSSITTSSTSTTSTSTTSTSATSTSTSATLTSTTRTYSSTVSSTFTTSTVTTATSTSTTQSISSTTWTNTTTSTMTTTSSTATTETSTSTTNTLSMTSTVSSSSTTSSSTTSSTSSESSTSSSTSSITSSSSTETSTSSSTSSSTSTTSSSATTTSSSATTTSSTTMTTTSSTATASVTSSTTSTSGTSTTTATLKPGTCPPPVLVGIYDASECIYQQPGDSCLVYCANNNGWYGPPSQFNCTTDEVYVGTPPECFTTTSTSTKTMTKTELVVCNGGLPLGVGIDLSGCSGQVMSGEICTVTCAQGFEGTPQDYICNPFTARFEGQAMACQRQRCDVQTLPTRTDLDLTGCQNTVVGDFCLVSCGEGYVPTDASFQCMSDLSFQGTAPTCERLPCDPSTLPTTEGLDTSSCLGLLVGDTCSVTCLSGYAATVSSTDPATMQCHLNTSFTGTAPECKAKDCLVPSIWASDPSFNTMCDGTKHGDTCVGQCSAGYTGQSAQFQCNNGQLWGAPPTCAGLVCAFQGFELSVGLLASDCYGKTTGETCQMQCIRGYDLVGDPSSTCQADGSFTTPTSVCQPKTCGSLSSVAPFSTVDVADTCGNSSTFGEICMSYCDMGFDITGNTTVLICDEADTASAGYVEYIPETGQSLAAAQSSGPSCAARNCTVGIPNVLGATTDCNGKVTYETCTVEPSLGYTLQAGDSNTLQCLPDGSFNQTAPTILPGTCPDPSFGTGVGSSCQGKVIGSDCWAYCLSGWSGIPKKYVCAADVSANALLLQADSTEISCTYTGRRLNSGRRLQTGCTSTAVSAVGLSSPQYFSDCDGKADTEVCIAHCSFGWVMTETAPSIYTCSSGSLTGASLPTCTAVPCSFGFPSGLGIAHDCDGTRTSQTCSASCTGTGYTYASGASAEVWTCNAGGSLSGTLPQCERKSCTDLSVGSTYVHTCVNKLYQDACGVSCASGYRGTGAQFLCEADGTFSGTLPVCVGNPCQNDLPNSSSWSAANCDGLTTGQSCDVTCKLGFTGGSTNLTCDASGQLLGSMPVCQPNLCPASNQLVSVEHTHTCQDIAFGSSCTVFCASGYELDAGSSIQDWSCNLVGTTLQLQGTLPSCVPQPCSSGLPVNNSEVVSDCEGVRTGESCHQYCAMGYENTTEEANFVCQTSGQAGLASSQTTQCQPISCEGSSVNFSLVQHSCQGTVYSRSCYASCVQGYSATPEQWLCGDASMGPELGFQVYKGITLRGVVPSCVASPCEFNLPVGDQYSHNCTGVTTGSSCLVQCADGWDGMMEVMTCGTDAALSGSFPSCNPVTSTRTRTSSSTQSTTHSSTLTVDATSITATRTSSTSTVFSDTCPEEVPAIPGAGTFNCTGRDGAGQECRADCESPEQDGGNVTEAVILCRFDLVWEIRQSCPSLNAAAGTIPILVYVGITVASCAACMIAIGVLTYFGRKRDTVAPKKEHKEPKKVKVKEQPEPMLAWATPKSTGQQDFNMGDLPSRADVEQPPRPEDLEPSTPVPATPLALVPAEDEDPTPLRQGFAKPSPKKVTKELDIAMHAQGLGGTAEPESDSVLAPSGQQFDPYFWDWANQFWDWANDKDGAGQQALPPPPPPMIPNHGEMLRGIGAYSEGPPPLPPLPLKLHSRPYLGSPSVSPAAQHAPPPLTPLPATLRSQVSMPEEDPSPLHSLPLPSAVEMGHHHSEPVHSESSVSRQRTLEDLLYNPEIDGASRPPQAVAVRRRSSGRPRSRPGRRRSGRQNSVRDMSPTQERRNSRAAASLHDGASMSALEMFSLRSPQGPPELPAMRLSSPDTDARRSGSAASSAARSVASSGTLRRTAARNEVIVNIKDDPHQ